MKEALFYNKLKNKSVQCNLCPHNCVIKEENVGLCRVRKNIKGKLFSLVYAKPAAIQLDPLTKKPMYHFLPGEKALSIGTIGCQLNCWSCQNYNISQANPEEYQINDVQPEKIIEMCIKNNCRVIAYTYNDPVVFIEYVLDIAKLAKKKGIKNVIVSNGYINEKPLKELCKYIDGANIDLKSLDNNFYKKYCGAKLAPILNSLKILKEKKIYLEITNLLIPGENDEQKDIKKLVKWISENLNDIVLHFSRFFPMYKFQDKNETSIKTMEMAFKIGRKYLDYVYLGNLGRENNTYCKKCKKLLIERKGYDIGRINIKKGKCTGCGNKMTGVWSD